MNVRTTPLVRPCVFAVLAVVGSLFCASPKAFAERADKEKPAVILATTGTDDQLNQIQVYTGDVVLTKGTIILRADQLTTKQDPEGYNLGTAVSTTPGKLAYFKQKREGVDEYIEGQAERIIYDEKADVVHLINRAVVKRLVAGRDADETHGDKIDYNSRTELYNVESGGGIAPGSTATKPPRSTFIMQPKIKPGTATGPNSTPVQVQTQPSEPVQLKREPVLQSAPDRP
jgi:lipopolysaccharide export system protein LptA